MAASRTSLSTATPGGAWGELLESSAWGGRVPAVRAAVEEAVEQGPSGEELVESSSAG